MKAKWLHLAFIVMLLIAGAAAKNQIKNSIDFRKLVENESNELILDQQCIKVPLDTYQLGDYFYKKITIKNCSFEDDVHFDKMKFLEDVILENNSFKKEVLFPRVTFLKNVSFKDSKFEKKVDFSSAEFGGSADFSGVNFNGSVRFVNSNLTSSANFLNARFWDIANFVDAKFYGPTQLSYSEFRGPTFFSGTKFMDNLSALRCYFFKGSQFSNADFHNTTDFSNSNFYELNDFGVSEFYGDSHFHNVLFLGPVNFKKSKFHKLARFFGSTYNDSADFSLANFTNDVDFSKSTYKDEAIFAGSKFGGYANFAGASLGDANFWKSNFMRGADFSESKFNEAFFEGSNFSGTLNLNKAKYDKMYIRIENISKLEFDETTYKTLIDNFKKIGFLDDANHCYYRFMIEYGYLKFPGFSFFIILNNKILDSLRSLRYVSAATVERSFLSFYYLFSWTLYGFGTRPEFTLIWSIILMIFIFGPFWWLVQKKSSIKKVDEYSWDNYDHKTSMKSDLNTKFYEIANAILLSCSIFLSGTKFFIDPPELPETLKRATPWVNRVFNLERFLGGVLSILFFIAIGSIIFSV
jgi:uncharacterized protein YjbI with pentapeptide repeats